MIYYARFRQRTVCGGERCLSIPSKIEPYLKLIACCIDGIFIVLNIPLFLNQEGEDNGKENRHRQGI
ncbi:MAG: hypothetical protein J5532_09995, partial [Lachnospiraceae bacterium]|nr:hypothetical protein [Lachnospiraceae bacterium]